MKSFADWTQEIAESNNMEPEAPDATDQAADGLGYACAHYGYVTCPHCGYDFVAQDYVFHVAEKHPGTWVELANGTKIIFHEGIEHDS